LKKDPIFALTIPSKIQSYLACAKPIVAALDGEGSRIVEEAEAGVTCSSQNPIELANAVIKLYEMSEKERQEMGQRGRAYFERNFEREMLLDRLVGWMKEVAVQRRGTHANFDSRR
jgi:glycosyltransferase involved in cell wall biosynthesis